MKTLLKPLLAALCLLALSAPTMAQVQSRAYAPEDLRALSYNDQVRVIRQEYFEQSGGQRIADDQLRFYIDQVNRSSWRFSDIKRDIAESLGGDVYPPGGGSGTVRCESTDNRNRTCPTPWRGRSQLVRQISKTTCVEDRNWASENGLVTVWKGCRAAFAPAYGGGPGHGDGYTVSCASHNGRYATCNWPPGQGRPRLIQQLSPQACVKGRTWGTLGNNRIWVNGGCRAVFGN